MSEEYGVPPPPASSVTQSLGGYVWQLSVLILVLEMAAWNKICFQLGRAIRETGQVRPWTSGCMANTNDAH